MSIDSVKIFPPIGIARLGNSPTEFFIGPEIPGDYTPPPGGYKDGACRIKRQAARFRMFGYDAGVLQGEITAADADITWTVELANTKSEWKEFGGIEAQNQPWHNATIANRASLKITPAPRTLTGPNQSASFDNGAFRGALVPLGDIKTDSEGRLLVLGGFGNSSSPENYALVHWANNDGWHDDVSDGPVTATVKMNGSNVTLQAAPAWVICAPPKFAPAIEPIKSLYDTLLQVAVDKFNYPVPSPPSFTNDIYPLLKRAMDMKWVSAQGGADHGVFGPLIPPPGAQATRDFIFNNLRDPATPAHTVTPASDMPKIWSDVYARPNPVNEALTPTQYAIMKNWNQGNFVNDWVGPPVPGNAITPEGLTRAALEKCIGGAFYPGIETSFLTRDHYVYLEPFRLDHDVLLQPENLKLAPGDLTKQMAVPWQTDFWDCSFDSGLLWWPAARPDDVFPEGGGAQTPWAGSIVTSKEQMVTNWHQLGFVVPQGNQMVETQRAPCKSCYFIIDKSTFGQDEVEVKLPGTASFDSAYWIAVEGFIAADLGLTINNLNNPPLKPTVTATIDPILNPTLDPNQVAKINGMLSVSDFSSPLVAQDPTLQQTYQRFMYPFAIKFTGDLGFTALQANQAAMVTLNASITAGNVTRTASAVIELTKGQDPYFLDVNPNDPNQPFWLSFDLRFFKVSGGHSRFGAPNMSNDPNDAPQFIQNVLHNLNTPNADLGGDTFGALLQDEEASALEFLQQDQTNQYTFNFALARGRLIGKTANAKAQTVRVFFRLFQAQTTGSEFNDQTTYRFGSDGVAYGHKIGLLGVQNDWNGQPEYVTIPCFAKARINLMNPADMNAQDDPLNARDILVNPGVEVDTYFGCWLDINQPQQKFLPLSPPMNWDGPWTAEFNNNQLHSLNEVITRSPHQCLIAEIRFDDTPVPAGATSATSDKIAQRNIAWIDGPNPGADASRRMPHPIEIRATPVTVRSPDELMITWGNTPQEATASLYLPAVSATEILSLAAARYASHSLTIEDSNTIRFPANGVTFIPIPKGTARNAGLMTVDLPSGVRRGQHFDIRVRQLTEAASVFKGAFGRTFAGAPAVQGFTWRRVDGAFQLTLSISTKEEILYPEERLLAWLRWIQSTMPAQNRWYPVFQRYIDQIAGRVRGLGGDPDGIAGSPYGTVPKPPSRECKSRWLIPLILAPLLVLIPLAPLVWSGPIAAAGFVLIFAGMCYWYWQCQPTLCDVLFAVFLGITAAYAVLGTIALLGYRSLSLVLMLAVLAVLDGLLAVTLALRGCCLHCAESQVNR